MSPRPWQWQRWLAFSVVLLVPFYNLVLSQSAGSGSRRSSPCDQWDACSQLCEEVEHGLNVSCRCMPDFRLGDDNRSCIPIEPTVNIAIALRNSIKIFNVNRTASSRMMTLADNKGQTIGVTVDVANGYVYWTDVTERKEAVYRAKVSGEGNIETVVDTGLQLPEGIAFDWITGNIYIVDSDRSHIVVCRNDGKYCTVLVKQALMDKPRDVALHPIRGVMFWTDWGEKSAILRASMDGSSAAAIVTDDIKLPNALAVDLGRNRLYWTDAFHDKIETTTLTGDDRQLVNMDKIKHPFSMDIIGDTLYWSDWELKQILACTKFACKSDYRVVYNASITQITNGVAIVHPASQPRTRPNPCESKCSHICVLSGKSGYSCKCPSGFTLDKSTKTCIEENKGKILIGHDNYLKTYRFDSIGRDVDVVEEIRIPFLKTIGAMVYNPVNDTVFLSDLTYKSINEYSFATRQTRTVSNKHLDSVKSMSLDPVGENLYWVDSTRRKVEVMSCRTGHKAIIAMEADHPQSLVVVPEERFLFVALTGRRGGRILRMNMNGYNRRTLVRTNRGEPIALTYNSEIKRIFWIDSTKDTIEHVSMSGRSQVMAERSGTPYGMASYQNRIFWTDRHTQLLHSIPIFGMDLKDAPVFVGHVDDKYTNGTVESYIKGNFLATLTIANRDTTVYENLTRFHECSTMRKPRKCSHICLFSAEVDIGTCVCPDGMQLHEDNVTCSWATTCDSSQFQCRDKRCIDSDWVCDGVPDCEGGEDELKCGGDLTICTGDTDFMCESDKSCIHSKWKCDGERDCPNGEDEFNCGSHICAPDTEFQCNNGRCIPIAWKCDHQFECADGEDELGCNRSCPIGTFQCKKDLECISVDWVCDGESDCSDGSDEHGHCEVPCSSNSFRCLDHHCIPGFLACNGVNDCTDNSDEFDCNMTSPIVPRIDDVPSVEADNETSRITSNGILDPCSSDKFTCFTGDCLSYSKVCDDKIDCPDGSDEGRGCKESCLDTDECPHGCLRTPIGSICKCLRGYEQDRHNKRACVDVNECLMGHPCDHICLNLRGSFKCDCHENYALRSDLRRCKPKVKSIKPSYINPADRVEPSAAESRHDTSARGSSAGWWVFGIFLILLLVGAGVGYVLHRKRLHPKILFERYAHHIPVKFNLRRGAATHGPTAPDEETYQDFSDGRALTSSDHAGLLNHMESI